MIFSWSERMVNHIGIEKRSKRIYAAAVRNIGQCANKRDPAILREW